MIKPIILGILSLLVISTALTLDTHAEAQTLYSYHTQPYYGTDVTNLPINTVYQYDQNQDPDNPSYAYFQVEMVNGQPHLFEGNDYAGQGEISWVDLLDPDQGGFTNEQLGFSQSTQQDTPPPTKTNYGIFPVSTLSTILSTLIAVISDNVIIIIGVLALAVGIVFVMNWFKNQTKTKRLTGGT